MKKQHLGVFGILAMVAAVLFGCGDGDTVAVDRSQTIINPGIPPAEPGVIREPVIVRNDDDTVWLLFFEEWLATAEGWNGQIPYILGEMNSWEFTPGYELRQFDDGAWGILFDFIDCFRFAVAYEGDDGDPVYAKIEVFDLALDYIMVEGGEIAFSFCSDDPTIDDPPADDPPADDPPPADVAPPAIKEGTDDVRVPQRLIDLIEGGYKANRPVYVLGDMNNWTRNANYEVLKKDDGKWLLPNVVCRGRFGVAQFDDLGNPHYAQVEYYYATPAGQASLSRQVEEGWVNFNERNEPAMIFCSGS